MHANRNPKTRCTAGRKDGARTDPLPSASTAERMRHSEALSHCPVLHHTLAAVRSYLWPCRTPLLAPAVAEGVARSPRLAKLIAVGPAVGSKGGGAGGRVDVTRGSLCEQCAPLPPRAAYVASLSHVRPPEPRRNSTLYITCLSSRYQPTSVSPHLPRRPPARAHALVDHGAVVPRRVGEQAGGGSRQALRGRSGIRGLGNTKLAGGA